MQTVRTNSNSEVHLDSQYEQQQKPSFQDITDLVKNEPSWFKEQWTTGWRWNLKYDYLHIAEGIRILVKAILQAVFTIIPIMPIVSFYKERKKTDSYLIKKMGFEIQKCIGKGSFGTVYKINHPKTNTVYAYKKFNRKEIEKHPYNKASGVRGECTASILPKHSNLLKTEAFIIYNTNSKKYKVVTQLDSCARSDIIIGVISEFIPDAQELCNFMKNNTLSKKEVQSIGLQILKGLIAMHQQRIAHRDIKDENILICMDGNVKVFDYGLSKQIKTRKITN